MMILSLCRSKFSFAGCMSVCVCPKLEVIELLEILCLYNKRACFMSALISYNLLG